LQAATGGYITGALACNNGGTGIAFTGGATGGTLLKVNYNPYGIQISTSAYGTMIKIDEVLECIGNTYGIYFAGNGGTINKISNLNLNSYGLYYSAVFNNLVREVVLANGNTTALIYFNASGSYNKILKIGSADSNQSFVIFSGFENYIYNAVLSNTKTDGTSISHINPAKNYLINCSGVTNNATAITTGYRANSKLFIHNHNLTGAHRIYCEGATIFSDTVERHSVTGISWKFSIISVDRSVNYPVDLSIAKILCTAGVQKTIAIWCKKSHATDIGCRLVIQGNKFEGVGSTDSDVFVEAVNVTGWQQISMTFTPAKTEVIEVEFWAYWLANLADEFVWVDDISIV